MCVYGAQVWGRGHVHVCVSGGMRWGACACSGLEQMGGGGTHVG